ncbi:coiled-coil domain-containing protein 157 isoform X2 [Colius striatus]|uniref:coiled-coil domain-containing protein 157 isoform X2 n=1 Tax=Colius striatus TaxID=57412 RepID=UPI002B1D223A|nr:coiled-coil domain-containing protein 157 isoform X2 [Colius striatus]
MAFLLGSRACMDSLRADLRDLQAAIAEVSSRAGAVRFPSWKFPGQVSCELDLEALLQRYGYSEGDPEFTQHSHVVLLELLIDRLLLLLQSFTGYTELLLSERDIPAVQTLGPVMSAGLTVRRYWSSMLKLGTSYRQLLAEEACRKEISTLQAAAQAGRAEQQPVKDSMPDVLELQPSRAAAQCPSPCPSSGAAAAGSEAWGSPVPGAVGSTALSSPCSPPPPAGPRGACAACAAAQAGLGELGKAIAGICQSQNIPSALGSFQESVEAASETGTLCARDVSCWASEQSKDLSRISRHLQLLLQQLKPLKAELAESGKEKEKLQKQVEEFSQLLQAEKEAQAQLRKKAEHKLKAKIQEHSKAVARLEQDKDELRRGAAQLEEQISALKEELSAKQAAVQELEETKMTLLERMRSTMVAKSRVEELEEKLQELSIHRESLGQELSSTTVQLEKEKAKVESVLRHHESLQAKQQLLLQQLDSMDQEREGLQASLGEAEEDKARLAEQLEESQEQSGQQLRAQQELLDVLQQEKLSLEQSVSELQVKVSELQQEAQELKERERLLVFFPELHVPAETQLESTGNLTEDMEKQLQANSIRISALEQENTRLRSALAKVKAAAEQGTLQLVPQAQLQSQLSRQQSRAAGRQDAGQPSGRGRAGEPGHSAPGSPRPKPPAAEPGRRAGAFLPLPAAALHFRSPVPRGRSRARFPSAPPGAGLRK